MRGKSHQSLGRYLAEVYMPDIAKRHRKAFLIGCIEPDRNPATYLKGSIHQQWLRGHNWGNAQHYMQRVSLRLEKRRKLNLYDFYTMGKLIHYTMDAFTSAHNVEFGRSLADHRIYEANLQDYFLDYLSKKPAINAKSFLPAMDTIRFYHRDYIRRPVDIHTDTDFAIRVSAMVVSRLFPASPMPA